MNGQLPLAASGQIPMATHVTSNVTDVWQPIDLSGAHCSGGMVTALIGCTCVPLVSQVEAKPVGPPLIV